MDKKIKNLEYYMLEKDIERFQEAIDNLPISDSEQVLLYENKIKNALRDMAELEAENSKLRKRNQFLTF